jgi:hypothetical protein
MIETSERQAAIRTMFPDLSEEKRLEVQEVLDGYCEILLRIYERLERERKEHFDDSARPS